MSNVKQFLESLGYNFIDNQPRRYGNFGIVYRVKKDKKVFCVKCIDISDY